MGDGMVFWRSLAFAAALVLVACGFDFKIDADAVAASDKAYAQLVRGEAKALLASLPSEYQTPDQEAVVSALRAMIPEGQAEEAKLVGFNRTTSLAGQQIGLTVIYDYGNRHVAFTSTWRRIKDSEAWALFGFNLSLPTSQLIAAPSLAPAAAPPIKTAEPKPAPA